MLMRVYGYLSSIGLGIWRPNSSVKEVNFKPTYIGLFIVIKVCVETATMFLMSL